VSNLLTLIGTNFGERLMYLPSAFFVLYAATLLSRLPRGAMVAIATIAIVAGSVQTVTYARRWNDRLSFYEWAAREQPDAIRLHMLLMGELKAQRRLDEAAAEADRARELLPNYDEIWIHSADIAMERGRFDEAESFLDRAMHIRPSLKIDSWMQNLRKRRAATQPATSQ
jgi:tetratricopeptide (TPR) repeat protein